MKLILTNKSIQELGINSKTEEININDLIESVTKNSIATDLHTVVLPGLDNWKENIADENGMISLKSLGMIVKIGV